MSSSNRPRFARQFVAAQVLIVAMGAVIALLADRYDSFGATTTDDEAPERPGPQGQAGLGQTASGTVTDIARSTLTLSTPDDQTIDVRRAADTFIDEIAEISVDDLAVGHNILVTGSAVNGGGIYAEQILDSGSDPPADGSTTGSITSINGSAISLATSDGGSLTVTTSPATVVLQLTPLSFGDLVIGEEITVMGMTDRDTLIAAWIRQGDAALARLVNPWGPAADIPPRATSPADPASWRVQPRSVRVPISQTASSLAVFATLAWSPRPERTSLPAVPAQ